jgi:hypothetical protein
MRNYKDADVRRLLIPRSSGKYVDTTIEVFVLGAQREGKVSSIWQKSDKNRRGERRPMRRLEGS